MWASTHMNMHTPPKQKGKYSGRDLNTYLSSMYPKNQIAHTPNRKKMVKNSHAQYLANWECNIE